MDASGWDARYAETDRVWSAEPNRWVAAELVGLPAGRALDLAAGEGRNALWLAERGWQVTAVDFSAVALEKGRAEDLAGRVQWVHADVLDLVLDAGSYDLVIAAYLHLVAAERRLVVGHAVRALAAGGVLFVVGHDTTNLTDGTGGPQHADVLFTPSDIVDDLTASGEPVRIERADRVLRPVDGAPRQAIDALVHATRR
ncbi:MAG: class I SAM-dependent methyltransferase [Actinomycetota bacterium]